MSARRSELARALGQFSLISLEIVALTAIPAWFGHWLEVNKGAPSWTVVLLGFAGFGAAIFRMWQRMESDRKKDES